MLHEIGLLIRQPLGLLIAILELLPDRLNLCLSIRQGPAGPVQLAEQLILLLALFVER